MAGIAIVTGASSGLGREYVRQIVIQKPDIQEIWLIARRREKLEAVAAEIPEKNFAIFSLDLAEKESFEILRSSLEQKKPNVEILINNSGFGKLGYFEEIPLEQEAGMVDVNIRAMVCLTHIVLPYMNSGAVILNTCSIAAYIPNPRMTVYSSTKAFVFSFSKALRQELKRKNINVHAACPGPMDTEFLQVAEITQGKSPLFDGIPRVNPGEMAEKSLKKAMRGKAVYTNKLLYKLYRVLCKIVPHNWLMKQFTA